MSLMSGSASFMQFLVEGNAETADFESWIGDRLARHGFLPNDEIIKEKNTGWTTLDVPQDSTFENRRVFLRPPYVCFTFRRDERKVPSVVLKQAVEGECKRWLDEHPGMNRTPKAVKTEIKDRVYQVLLSKTMPVPSMFDVVWHTEASVAWISTLNIGDIDLFAEEFGKTFSGLRIVALHPFLRAQRLVPDAQRPELARANQSSSDLVTDLIQENRWIGRDFLLWLLYQTTNADSTYEVSQDGPKVLGESFTAFIDRRLVLVGEEEEGGSQKMVLTGPQKEFEEAKTAIRAKMQIEEASILFEAQEEFWRLTLKGELFGFNGFKTPKVHIERDALTDPEFEREAVFYEKMQLLEAGWQMFDSLFFSFLKDRLTPAWSEVLQGVRKWCGD